MLRNLFLKGGKLMDCREYIKVLKRGESKFEDTKI